jgi:hypothetical protein
MGLFHRHREPGPAKGGADGRFQIIGDDGKPLYYLPDDFDEIFSTTDEHEAGRHVKIGWLLLDEVVGKGDGPGREEFEMRATGEGRWLSTPVRRQSDDETTYILGYLKPGRVGKPS